MQRIFGQFQIARRTVRLFRKSNSTIGRYFKISTKYIFTDLFKKIFYNFSNRNFRAQFLIFEKRVVMKSVAIICRIVMVIILGTYEKLWQYSLESSDWTYHTLSIDMIFVPRGRKGLSDITRQGFSTSSSKCYRFTCNFQTKLASSFVHVVVT